MAHAQKPDFLFRRNGRLNLNRPGRQFSRLPAADVCASTVEMLDTPCVRGSVKSTGYPLHSPVSPHHFPSRASPYAITFHLESTENSSAVFFSGNFKLLLTIGLFKQVTVNGFFWVADKRRV